VHDWALCRGGVLPQDRLMAEALPARDHLYSVMVKHADGSRDARVIGSLIDYLFAPDDPEAVIARMAEPSVRIVSFTITKGGSSIDPSTRAFDPMSTDTPADLEGSGPPRSAFGPIVAALRRRRDGGIPPFTVQSCDKIQSNGGVAKHAIAAFARLVEPELADWIGAEVAFPNAMVDRITRVTIDEDRAGFAERLGVADRWPVVCEPVMQWAVEDHFSAGRPPWEQVGAQLVSGGAAIRVDEAPAAQREPPGPLLLRLPGGIPVRPRGPSRTSGSPRSCAAAWTVREHRRPTRCRA